MDVEMKVYRLGSRGWRKKGQGEGRRPSIFARALLSGIPVPIRGSWRLFALFFWAALMGGQVHAETLYWDANGAGPGTGGTGEWNKTDLTWRVGSTSGNLTNWSDNNNCCFTGTPGVLTLGDNITVGDNTTASLFYANGDFAIDADPGGLYKLTLDGNGGVGAYRLGFGGPGPCTINAPVELKGYSLDNRSNVTINGVVSDDGIARTLYNQNTARIQLNAPNTFSWGISAGGSTYGKGVVIGHDNALGTGTLTWQLIAAANGTRTVSGTYSTSWNWTNRFDGSSSLTWSDPQVFWAYNGTASILVYEAGAVLSYAGGLTKQATGHKGHFAKVGAGNLVVYSTYHCAWNTTVSAGGMIINCTTTAPDNNYGYIVEDGATLGGNGTIALATTGSNCTVRQGGVIAPCGRGA